jgi:hypothetical protein
LGMATDWISSRVRLSMCFTMPRRELACATIMTVRPDCRSGRIRECQRGSVRSCVCGGGSRRAG